LSQILHIELDQKICHNTGRSPAACLYPHTGNQFYTFPLAKQIDIWH